MTPRFKKITIVGVGLIGGSVGLAVKKRELSDEVVGFFRSTARITEAVKTGAVDRGTTNFTEAVRGADLIVLSSSVGDIVEKLRCLKKIGIPGGTLVTDTGSTKEEITQAAKGLNFIGAHPLAGSEHSGVAYARASLFENSACILTPTGKERHGSLDRVASFWRHLGSDTKTMSAASHDRILAFTSHLPHAAAYALISSIPQDTLACAAGGLRDTTRIAMSHAEIWADIFLSNRKNILRSLKKYENALGQLMRAVACADRKTLLRLLRAGRKKRESIAGTP